MKYADYVQYYLHPERGPLYIVAYWDDELLKWFGWAAPGRLVSSETLKDLPVTHFVNRRSALRRARYLISALLKG